MYSENIIEENIMLKKEVLEIRKVKQLIVEKTEELNEARMISQSRDLLRQ